MTPNESLTVAKQTLLVVSPEILMIVVATAMMTAGAFVRLPRRAWALASLGTFVAATIGLILLRTTVPDPYAAVAINDPMSGYCRLAFLLTGLVILALAHNQVDDARAPEFFGALLMIHAGAMLVAAANDLIFLFAGLELVSMPTYLLLYLSRRNATTQEAATKYFFLSIFSSGLLLFGFAYFYGMTGLSNLRAISYVVQYQHNILRYPQAEVALIALVFVMAGLGFRVAAVPFHWYAPDVYEGSPTVITALLSWIPKGVGFIAILRVLTTAFGKIAVRDEMTSFEAISSKGALIAGILAVATMTLGNMVALRQESLKRLLAYSSIAHAGYLLVGIAAAFRNGSMRVGYPDSFYKGPEIFPSFLGGEAVLLYLATYALMTLGAFGVIILLSTPERSVETVDDLSGLFWTHPAAALALILCLFSLAGVPPMAGFFGKFWIFSSLYAVAYGPDARGFQTLGIIGMLNAAIGGYYYLRVIVKMTFSPKPDLPLNPRFAWPTVAAVGACASLSLILGIVIVPLVSASRASAEGALTLAPPAGEKEVAVTQPAPRPASPQPQPRRIMGAPGLAQPAPAAGRP